MVHNNMQSDRTRGRWAGINIPSSLVCPAADSALFPVTRSGNLPFQGIQRKPPPPRRSPPRRSTPEETGIQGQRLSFRVRHIPPEDVQPPTIAALASTAPASASRPPIGKGKGKPDAKSHGNVAASPLPPLPQQRSRVKPAAKPNAEAAAEPAKPPIVRAPPPTSPASKPTSPPPPLLPALSSNCRQHQPSAFVLQ